MVDAVDAILGKYKPSPTNLYVGGGLLFETTRSDNEVLPR